MSDMQAELLYKAGAVLAEGPGWNQESKQILWVDIERGIINRLDPANGKNQSWNLGGKAGFAVETEQGDILVGTQSGLVRLNPITGKVSRLANPEADLVDNRFNDGKCDELGRCWAGTMSIHETKNAGSLYLIRENLDVSRAFGDVTISNGLTWSSDGRTMYYIDTPTMRIDAFNYDLETASISHRRTVIKIPEGIGYPDGMTIDADGMLWIAMWAGWAVTRWNPNTGEMIGKISLPVEKVTACCFGGDNLDKLFITSASRDLTEEELKKQPEAGSLFVATPGVTGLPTNKFRG